MSQKNFVNYHILISHSPSCLNRDDINMQKTAIFGGVRRVRISSQSLKRAMRENDYYLTNLGKPSTRTRELEKIKAKLIDELRNEFEEKLIAETVERFVKASNTDDKSDAEENEAEDTVNEEETKKSNKLAVAPWVTNEIRELCRIVKTVKDGGLTEKELASIKEKFNKQKGKKKKTEQEIIGELWDKKIQKEIDEKGEGLRTAFSTAVDIALSGRMATSGLMTSADGALAVAHVITTHAVDGDIDWFTAVDDLVADAGEVGAGHLNTQEFSAGVFYRYASLNIQQLQKNLGGANRERAVEIAKHLLHLLATVVPSAKQQTFAAHNLADFALVSFADHPISLANAFEAPIKNGRDGGFLQASMEKLVEYWGTINAKYGLDEQAAAFGLRDIDLPEALKPCATFTEIGNLG
ncbi:MAG: type I-E CRISPR-associated protein Cas7/Cse4/CasC [Gammaproteobacteria bacterium]